MPRFGISSSVFHKGPRVVSNPLSRLAISGDGRYFTKNGQPFRWQGAVGWNMPINCSTSDMDTFFTDIASRGFNVFLVMNFVTSAFDGSANFNGVEPFADAGHVNFNQPNDAYFDYITTIIDKAAAHNLYVAIFYCYMGNNGGSEGWYSALTNGNNTQSVCFAFGQYLGARWKDKANLILMHSGDYTIPDGEGQTRAHKILEGLVAAGCTQLRGAELSPPDSMITDQNNFTFGTDPTTADLNINSCYGYGPSGGNNQTYDTADRSWTNTPTLPAVLEEPPYDYSGQFGTHGNRADVRAASWWFNVAGGIAGGNIGWQDVWNFQTNWQAQLSRNSVLDQQNLFSFFASLSWHLQRPSGTASGYAGRVLVVSGAGSGDSQIVSSLASDGSSMIVYVPNTGTGATTFSCDLRGLNGTKTAKWFNPTSGAYTTVGSFANSLSSQSFTTPGNNGTSTNDWALVLL